MLSIQEMLADLKGYILDKEARSHPFRNEENFAKIAIMFIIALLRPFPHLFWTVHKWVGLPYVDAPLPFYSSSLIPNVDQNSGPCFCL